MSGIRDKSKNVLSKWVRQALTSRTVDIGQLSAEDRRDLDRAVKQGLLVKGRGGGFPLLKTVYAAPGYDFQGEREKAIAELRRLAE